MKNRKSNFELLRIFCVFAILYMHTFGNLLFAPPHSSIGLGINYYVSRFEAALFNTGVACFMLISGYFGFKRTIQKLVHIEMTVLFFSILAFFCAISEQMQMPRQTLLSYFLPIISSKNWFVSCYVWLLLCSPYINLFLSTISKETFRKLLATLLLLFSIIPTLFYFEITGDGGKGIIHLFIIYLIGHYIKAYVPVGLPKLKLFLLFCISVALNFLLNIVSGKIGMELIFVRDCSFTIILSSVILFLLFREFSFYSAIINRIASNSMAIIVSEGVIRYILKSIGFYQILHPDFYADKWYAGLITVLYVLCAMMIGCALNELRKLLFSKIEHQVTARFTMYAHFLKEKLS